MWVNLECYGFLQTMPGNKSLQQFEYGVNVVAQSGGKVALHFPDINGPLTIGAPLLDMLVQPEEWMPYKGEGVAGVPPKHLMAFPHSSLSLYLSFVSLPTFCHPGNPL